MIEAQCYHKCFPRMAGDTLADQSGKRFLLLLIQRLILWWQFP
jgi:hypothetical protein